MVFLPPKLCCILRVMNIERGIGGLPPDTKRESNVIVMFKTLLLDRCLKYMQKQNISGH